MLTVSETTIQEISPFCFNDLEPESIYILDAFFEIYILVGSMAQTQFAAFQHSLMFAQEYGILAASMEDRPFVREYTRDVLIAAFPNKSQLSARLF